MKSKIDKSLIEVWEMKDAAWKAFKESGYSSYAEYIFDSLKEIKKKYNIKYEIEREEENNLMKA